MDVSGSAKSTNLSTHVEEPFRFFFSFRHALLLGEQVVVSDANGSKRNITISIFPADDQ